MSEPPFPIFNRDCIFGYCKVVYPQLRLPGKPRSVFADVGLKAAQFGDWGAAQLRRYASYLRKLRELYKVPVLAVVPDTFLDAGKNIALAKGFLKVVSNGFRGSGVRFLVVLHVLSGHVSEYRDVVLSYMEAGLDVGVAIPCKASDVREPVVQCREDPRACAERVTWAVGAIGLPNTHVHLLGVRKQTLRELLRWRFVPGSVDTDAYRLVSTSGLRWNCLGDGRYMIDESRCSPEEWLREWLRGLA
jgi:hypothetical protein